MPRYDDESGDHEEYRPRRRKGARRRPEEPLLTGRRGHGLFWLSLLALAGGGGVVAYLMLSGGNRAFDEHLPEYLNGGPRGGAIPGTRPRSGKAIVVDVKTKKVDEAQDELPSDLRARAPNEVALVVRV